MGYGQLHPRLRGDARVAAIERTNARTLEVLPSIRISSSTTSRSSLTTALPAIPARPHRLEPIVLVKPQFEAGKHNIAKANIHSPKVHPSTTNTLLF